VVAWLLRFSFFNQPVLVCGMTQKKKLYVFNFASLAWKALVRYLNSFKEN